MVWNRNSGRMRGRHDDDLLAPEGAAAAVTILFSIITVVVAWTVLVAAVVDLFQDWLPRAPGP